MITPVSMPEEHQLHLRAKHYCFVTCMECVVLLHQAQANHRDHAGYPTPEGWVITGHTNLECVDAYIEYASKMSES